MFDVAHDGVIILGGAIILCVTAVVLLVFRRGAKKLEIRGLGIRVLLESEDEA